MLYLWNVILYLLNAIIYLFLFIYKCLSLYTSILLMIRYKLYIYIYI